jgi:putative glutathione S-transferase
VKLFPATEDGGWFFEPQSDGEKALARKIPSDNVDKDPYGHHHLEQLYLKANPNFTGVISVPLLWDKVSNTAVSNSSLGLSKMFYEQFMPSLATRNHHIQLFPPPDDEGASSEHSELVGFIHDKITTKVYKITASKDSTSHDTMVEEYYESLSEMERRLKCNDEKQKRQETSTKTLAYLMGDKVRFADIVLWISLIRLDLCYQFRFGLGKCNVREGTHG